MFQRVNFLRPDFLVDLLTQKQAPTIGDSGRNSARIIETILIPPYGAC